MFSLVSYRFCVLFIYVCVYVMYLFIIIIYLCMIDYIENTIKITQTYYYYYYC